MTDNAASCSLYGNSAQPLWDLIPGWRRYLMPSSNWFAALCFTEREYLFFTMDNCCSKGNLLLLFAKKCKLTCRRISRIWPKYPFRKSTNVKFILGAKTRSIHWNLKFNSTESNCPHSVRLWNPNKQTRESELHMWMGSQFGWCTNWCGLHQSSPLPNPLWKPTPNRLGCHWKRLSRWLGVWWCWWQRGRLPIGRKSVRQNRLAGRID